MKLHSVELEKKLRLPDPTKTLEGVWKMLKRTKQQIDMVHGEDVGVSGATSQVLLEKKRAKMDAERHKAQGTMYAMRTAIR
jgi:predicted exporter